MAAHDTVELVAAPDVVEGKYLLMMPYNLL